MTTPKPRGGLRQGAGRPHEENPVVEMKLTFKPEIKAKLQKLASNSGISASEWVAQKIERARN
jgi:predicted HicB family RNase H-like nuclease